MFQEQAMRMLRTKWKTAQSLAEELFAIFRSAKLEHEGPVEFTVPQGSQFIIRTSPNAPGTVGQIGDIRLGDIQDNYQFGDGTDFPPFQPYPYPSIDYPQFGQPAVIFDVPVVFRDVIYQGSDPIRFDPHQDPPVPDPDEPPEEEEPAEEDIQDPAEPADGGDEGGQFPEDASGSAAFLAKVTGGTGGTWTCDIYAEGPDKSATDTGASVTIMNIADDEEAPVDHWIHVMGYYVDSAFESEAGWFYFAQPPVWLE